MKKIKFEDALKRLEAIVDKLESGALDLEDSIKLYEEGIDLSVYCQKQLNQAEGKIQRLVIEYQLDTKQLEIDLNELREKLKTVVKKENIGDVV